MIKHKVHFQMIGTSGPICVLLYGYGGNPRHWTAVAEQLSQTHRVVVPQLTSIYMSKDPLFFTVQVELILKFVEEHFRGEVIKLAGMSYGGLLAWAMSLQRPDLFERVYLVNPMLPNALSYVQIPELKYVLRIPFNFQALSILLASPIGKRFLSKTAIILGNESDSNSARIESLSGRKLFFISRMIHHFSWLMKNEDWNWWIKKSTAKKSKNATRIIFSKNDPLFSEKVYKNFFDENGFLSFISLDTGGHLLSLSQPQKIAELISLDRIDSAGEKISA